MKFLSIASVAAVAAAVIGGAAFAADAGNSSGTSGAVVAPKPAASAPAASASSPAPVVAPKPTASNAPAPAAAQGITRQAYLDLAGKRFDSMDANHDGILTGAERKAHNNKPAKEQGASSTVAPAKPSTAKM
jgi:hypothetical protein